MLRQRRVWIDRNSYHIIHRCHERSFLLKFSKYRDLYFHYLREMTKRYKVDILNYIDMNMVRAGVVSHPSEWKHCGYQEITGSKKRYKAINIKRLLNCLEMSGYNKFHE